MSSAKTPEPEPKVAFKRLSDEEIIFFREVIVYLISGLGHGGLTRMADLLNASPSHLIKKLKSKKGLDALSLRIGYMAGVLEEKAFKANNPEAIPLSSEEWANMKVTVLEIGGETFPVWSEKK